MVLNGFPVQGLPTVGSSASWSMAGHGSAFCFDSGRADCPASFVSAPFGAMPASEQTDRMVGAILRVRGAAP